MIDCILNWADDFLKMKIIQSNPLSYLSNNNSRCNTGCEFPSHNGWLNLYSRGPRSSDGGDEVHLLSEDSNTIG